MNSNIAIIGGGAAGMVAAIAAGRLGARVRVLERMSRVGKKLLATGNGRCNLTNLNVDASRYHGGRPLFVRDALEQFGVQKTLTFFEELGVLTRVEEDGQLFPITHQASSVLDVLRYEMERLGVEVVCDVNVQKVSGAAGRFVCTSTDGREFAGGKIILAAGGKSSPNLGSNGGGFKLAEALGHRIERPVPALVQLKSDAPYLKHLAGVRVEAGVDVFINHEAKDRDRGEILFTDYGLSGPPILKLSRAVACAAGGGAAGGGGAAMVVRIDLFPEMEEAALAALIAQRIARDPAKPLELSFVGLLPKRLIAVLLKEAGIQADLQAGCGKLSKTEIGAIAARLKAWEIAVSGTQSWMTSQVTAGGVDVRQIDSRTLESKLVPGLYFAGEVFDIDGDCGGYNLQWAWSSGYVAGVHAAG